MTEASQKPIIDWLQAHFGADHPVTIRQTAAALVFLAGPYAYKMKRAVDLGYLDFRRLASREAVCQRELALNQPLAPTLYLRLAHVTQEADGAFALDGAGEVVEPLVVMRRFDDQALAGTALDQGRIDEAMIIDFGRRIAQHHRGLAPVPASTVSARISQCLTAAATMADLLPAERLARIAERLRSEAGRFAAEEHSRQAAGLLRRGHGDLHLGNLCLLDQRLTAFDALEFSDDLASGDVLYDLAFPVMDLLYHQRPDLALALFDSYSRAAPDLALPCRLLPLFIGLRALIRAFACHAGWRGAGGATDAAPLAEIIGHLDLLEQAVPAPAPILIAIGGLSGSGKSTLARRLAPLLAPLPGAMVLRSDCLRKELAGVAPTVRLPPAQYTPENARKIYDALIARAGSLLAAGRSVIVDAVFAKPEERQAVAAVAAAQGADFHGLWLDIAEKAAIARVEWRRGDASDATAAVVSRQRHYDLGSINWARIDAGGPPAATLAAALPHLPAGYLTTSHLTTAPAAP